jgi:hypothetical protein
MSKKRLAMGTVAVGAALALVVTGAFAVEPQPGTFKGKAEPSGNPIKIRVTDDDDVEVTVTYCNYKMRDELGKSGKFRVAHRGPGGVYVGLDGGFPNKRTAKGTITTDFLCDSEGDEFTAKRI